MRGKSVILAVLLLVSSVFVSCNWDKTESGAEKETIELNGFSITLSEPKINFPNSIEFKVEAESEAEITDMALQYRMDRATILPVTSVVFPAFEQGEKTSAEWNWDMKQTGGLPPGASLSYWWSIEDASGRKAETPEKTLSFDDERYEWKEAQSSSFTLYWYNGDSNFSQQLVVAGEVALSVLGTDIGAKPERRIEVYVYGSAEALRGSLIYPQEWYGGVAYTEYGVVVLGISTAQLDWGERAMAHEMAHLVVHQATMNGYGIELPTWLDEGLAMYAEGDLSADDATILNKARAGKVALISVRSLSSTFPADTASAQLAYVESYSIVDYLLDHAGGRENMLDLLGAMKGGSGYEEALLDVYGLSIDELDYQWRQDLMAGGT